MRLLRAPDGADQRVEHVIHHHAPTSYIAGSRMDLLGHIGERRTRTRVGSRHAAVGNAGEEHSHHGDQDGGHHVPVPALAEHAENRHGRDRLNDDHAVENQIPQRQRPPQARRSVGHYRSITAQGRSFRLRSNAQDVSCRILSAIDATHTPNSFHQSMDFDAGRKSKV